MWTMANPALTDYIFDAPAPISKEYDFDIDGQEELYNSDQKSFIKASSLVGSYMGIYGLSSMMFALLLVFYTSKEELIGSWFIWLLYLWAESDFYLCILYL